MPYSEFTLRKARQDLAISIHEGERFFPDIAPVMPDDLLRQELAENLPLVLAKGSEKARSEWIISPVLTIDLTEYPLPPIEQILGFLLWMISSH